MAAHRKARNAWPLDHDTMHYISWHVPSKTYPRASEV